VLDATVGYARDLPGAGADILVAVQGEGGSIEEMEEMAAALGEATALVTGSAAADLVTSLQGRAFPSIYLSRTAGCGPPRTPRSSCTAPSQPLRCTSPRPGAEPRLVSSSARKGGAKRPRAADTRAPGPRARRTRPRRR